MDGSRQDGLATAFLAASVVGVFEGAIARFTALAALLPVVAGQAGNTGAGPRRHLWRRTETRTR